VTAGAVGAGGGVRAEAWTLDDARRAFEDDRVRARALVEGLDRDSFNRCARANAWSVGQCLDHLVIVGRQLVPRIDGALERARTLGLVAEPGCEITKSSWLERAIVRSMGPKSEREARLPTRAPEKFRPCATPLEPGEVLGRFDAIQCELIALVESARGLDLSRVRARSVVIPVVSARIGAWIAALAAHQDRHLLQAARARALALGTSADARSAA
jgi:hypothetical protein